MDVFALLFIVSFLALIFTLVVMSIRKSINKGKGDCLEKGVWYVNGEKITGLTDEELSFKGGADIWSCSKSSKMKREVNETQEKWKESLPKHSTRIKLRNSRKLRNKRKGKK